MYDVKVSPECADLLRRIFQVDPQRRITLADIQRWVLREGTAAVALQAAAALSAEQLLSLLCKLPNAAACRHPWFLRNLQEARLHLIFWGSLSLP